MKTPQEIREKWAIDNGYKDWNDVLQTTKNYPNIINGIIDAVCSLHAVSVLDHLKKNQ